MLDPDDESWTAAARRVATFACDAGFLVAPGVRPPPLPLLEGRFVLTAEAAAAPDVLGAHFRQAIALQAYTPFAVCPIIAETDKILTQGGWITDLPGTARILRALRDAAHAPPADGVIVDEIDQGSALRILARGRTAYLLDWDWEDDDAPLDGVALDLDALAAQAAAALPRLDALHAALCAALGADYWT